MQGLARNARLVWRDWSFTLLSFVATGGDHALLPGWMMPKGDEVPLWVIVACAAAIALGTAAGGTRIHAWRRSPAVC